MLMSWLKRNIRYFILSLFLLTNGVIIAESSLSGGESGSRSSLIALILSVFVNKTVPPVVHTYVPIESLEVREVATLTKINEGMNYTIPVGVTRRFSVSIYPENATDKGFVWSSSNPESVEVYPGGLIEARAIDSSVTVRVIPSDPAKTHSFNVIVTERSAPPTFEANLEKESLDEGTTTRLVVTADERQYDIKKLQYYSDDESIATINKYGVIKAIAPGQTTVGIRESDTKYNVTVLARSTPLVTPSSITLNMPESGYVYDKTPFTFSFDIDNVTDPSLTFESSNETVARIIKEDDQYYVLGYKISGSATITAYLNTDFSVTASKTITMNNVLPTTMTITANKLEAGVGSAIILTPQFSHDIAGKEDLDITNKKVLYTSSDESIARVTPSDLSGRVLGLKIGSVTITATSEANPALTESIELKIIEIPYINDGNFDDFQAFLRKALGHFSLFFVSGIFGFWTFYLFLKEKRITLTLVISLSIGLFIAIISEIIQLFVPLRAGLVGDVIIDFSGYLAATLIMLFILYLVKRRNIKKDARD